MSRMCAQLKPAIFAVHIIIMYMYMYTNIDIGFKCTCPLQYQQEIVTYGVLYISVPATKVWETPVLVPEPLPSPQLGSRIEEY